MRCSCTWCRTRRRPAASLGTYSTRLAADVATETRSFQVTIPAGTQQAAPLVTDVSFPSREVERITVKVPPGPSGLMGFALTMNGQRVIPINSGAWIITDDHTYDWAMTDLPNTGQWQVTGYNTDIYDHTLYIDFLVSPLGSLVSGGAAAADAAGTAAALQISAG